MPRLDRIPEPMRSHIADLECPKFETRPWIEGPPLSQRRVAMVSTAGLHRRNDRPFTIMSGDYRIIPGNVATNDLVMSHISTNFDRTGFQQDWNVVFPLDRLRGWPIKVLSAALLISTIPLWVQPIPSSWNPQRVIWQAFLKKTELMLSYSYLSDRFVRAPLVRSLIFLKRKGCRQPRSVSSVDTPSSSSRHELYGCHSNWAVLLPCRTMPHSRQKYCLLP